MTTISKELEKALTEEVKKKVTKDYPVSIFSLWKRKSKAGKPYFTGRNQGKDNLIGFYVLDKKNPKQPDLEVFLQGSEDGKLGEKLASIWCNVSKNGKKYFYGKILESGDKITGFLTNSTNEKAPYINFYLSDALESNKKKSKEDKKASDSKNEQTKMFEPIPDEELPF